MATYYVRTTGSDAAAGTSAAAAWLTIGKAMTTVSAGDTVWVGAGTYRVSSTIAPSSMASMTYLYGDTDGSKTGDAGEVIVTNYATNDTTAPTAIDVFTFSSKNYWTVGNLTVKAGGAKSGFWLNGTTNHVTIQDCAIFAGNVGIVYATPTWGTAWNVTIQRCRILSGAAAVYFQFASSSTGSDADMATVVKNCVLQSYGYNAVFGETSGGLTKKQGGVTILNCLIMGVVPSTTGGTVYVSGGVSSTYPMTVYNSLIIGYQTFYAGTTGMLVENYNVLASFSTARTNVTAGANSKSDESSNWRFSVGLEALYGAPTRPFGEFVAGSPLLTWGGTSVPTDDINGVTRPASGAGQNATQYALGPFERANSGTMEQVTYRDALPSVKIAGPGYHDFPLAVRSNTTTTVSLYMRYSSTYGLPQKPALYIVNGTEAGVAVTSNVMTGAADTWEQVSASFAATSNGVVTVRAISYSSNGPGSLYLDDMQASES